jgi:GTP cyclohydrolase I
MIMRFTDQAKEDKKLQKELFSINEDLKKNGLPKTIEGLKRMYDVYNIVYGQNKKITNCVYCRKSVAQYIDKAVLLLDIQPEKAIKTQRKKSAPKKKTTKTTRTK